MYNTEPLPPGPRDLVIYGAARILSPWDLLPLEEDWGPLFFAAVLPHLAA